MPKKKSSTDDLLRRIAILQAAIILGRKPSVGQLAKIVGIGKAELIGKLGKEKKSKKKPKKRVEVLAPDEGNVPEK